VCVALRGRGGSHRWVFDDLSLQSFLADAVDRRASPPFAIASIDGGDAINWHRRASGDDPAAMISDEFVPLLAERGLVTTEIGVWGWSLGGYGALLLATTLGPGRIAAVVASSPALWSTYGQAGPETFDGQADFAAHDLFTRTHQLEGIPLCIDCGTGDPFAANARRLRGALTPTPAGGLSAGCHDDAFWTRQAAAQIAFLGRHLS
jgi:S-formylglutathione hydrolase FrmB